MTQVSVPTELLAEAIARIRSAYISTDDHPNVLANELAAFLPQPDEARELLASAMEAAGMETAKLVRRGDHPPTNAAVAIIREGMERKTQFGTEGAIVPRPLPIGVEAILDALNRYWKPQP